MDLSKLSRESLEDLMCSLMDDLEDSHSPLLDKYTEAIEDELYYIDEEEAHHIVKMFKPYGEVYSISAIKEFLEKKGIYPEDNCLIRYYLVMNMMYNDYKAVQETYGLDANEFFYMMTKMFIEDIDAPKRKVEKYFKMFEED